MYFIWVTSYIRVGANPLLSFYLRGGIMAGKNICSLVDSLIRPVITGLGFELYDLVFVKEGSGWYLRVFIEKLNGVTIDDCVTVSRAVEKILDEKDPIEQSYILEVSSPGIDRPLKREADFERFKGSMVDVKLYKQQDRRKEFSGVLEGLQEGNIVIIDKSGNIFRFPKSNVALCRLAVVF